MPKCFWQFSTLRMKDNIKARQHTSPECALSQFMSRRKTKTGLAPNQVLDRIDTKVLKLSTYIKVFLNVHNCSALRILCIYPCQNR